MKPATASKLTLLVLLVFTTGLFLVMVRQMLVAIVLAAIFAALFSGLFLRYTRWFKGRRTAAAIGVVLTVLFGGLLPLAGFLAMVTAEAIHVGRAVQPWVQLQIQDRTALSETLQSLPFYDQVAPAIEPYREAIWTRAGEAVSLLSGLLVSSLSSLTVGTIQAVFLLFIFLYTLFFFLLDGPRLVQLLLYYLPMHEEDERRLLDRFTSVARATLKGTAVVGVVQGTLAGIAFAVAGIQGSLFWGTVMTVLSIIPGVGAALVWVPAAVVLAIGGEVGAAIGLAVFCALVVGSVDNLLRPRLVGKDTQLHELLVLFGTLGGLYFFGFAGIILGPIVAALTVTLWDMYGKVFGASLPDGPTTAPAAPSSPEEAPSGEATEA